MIESLIVDLGTGLILLFALTFVSAWLIAKLLFTGGLNK